MRSGFPGPQNPKSSAMKTTTWQCLTKVKRKVRKIARNVPRKMLSPAQRPKSFSLALFHSFALAISNTISKTISNSFFTTTNCSQGHTDKFQVPPDVALAPSTAWTNLPHPPHCALGPLPHTSPGRPLPEHHKKSQGVGGRRWGRAGREGL